MAYQQYILGIASKYLSIELQKKQEELKNRKEMEYVEIKFIERRTESSDLNTT